MYNSFDCGLWCNANCPAGCNCECNSEPCAPFSPIPCDAELGAGRVRDAAGTDCGLGAQRWFTPQTADPVGTFDCLGRVGIEGVPQERPIMALHRAITDLAGPGACNEGFLRNDALLVVTIISDEDDTLASVGDPPQWHDDIIAAKGGNENSVVVLALLGDPDLPGGLCPAFDPTDNSGAQPSTRLRAFTESFPFGFWSSVCQPDYSTFFSEVLTTIDEACEVFVPVG